MPVVVQTPFNAHIANGVSDTFGYDFQLILSTDLEVKLDGVVQTTGFTVNGVGDQAGGDVEFTSPPAANTLVELTRKIPLSRSTNYPYLGALPEDQVDNDFDRLWQALQDINYFGNTLSLKLPAGDVKAPMTLPSATSRASKYLAFDAEGGLIVSPGIADVPVSTFMATVVSAADAQAARDLLGAAASTNVRVDVASASTLNLDALTSDYSRITGTTTVTAATLTSGKRHLSVAGGAFQLTNSANLIVQGGVDYTTTAGDLLLFIGESGGVVRVFLMPYSGSTAGSVLRGYIDGFVMSTAGSSSTMTIGAGQATSSSGSASILLTSSLAKTTSSWAVGSGNGGLDTGSIANSTWYHFYAIRRPDTGVVDVVFSTSASAPTLPTNYTQYRRIGAGRTNGSAQWVKFVQDGDEFMWDTPVLDVDITNESSSAELRTLTVPTGVKVKAIVNAYQDPTGVSTESYFSDPDAADVAPSLTAAPLVTLIARGASVVRSGGQVTCRTNTSAQIRTRHTSGSGSNAFRIATLGWIDGRGKNF